MVILICGDRKWKDWLTIKNFLHRFNPKTTTIIEGECEGADYWAGYLARALGFNVKGYPADWTTHGKAAGPIRNTLMLDDNPNIDFVAAFHNNIAASKGTKNMVTQAKARGLEIWVLDTKGNEVQYE
jgi:hypothetical protein